MTSAMMAVKQVMMVTVTMCHYPYRTLPVRLPKVPMSKENCIIPSEYWSVGFLWQALGCITRGGHAHTAYTALGNIYPVYSAYILLQAVYIQYILRIYCSRQYIPSIYCVYILAQAIHIQYIMNWLYTQENCLFCIFLLICRLLTTIPDPFLAGPPSPAPRFWQQCSRQEKENRKEQNYYRHTW